MGLGAWVLLLDAREDHKTLSTHTPKPVTTARRRRSPPPAAGHHRRDPAHFRVSLIRVTSIRSLNLGVSTGYLLTEGISKPPMVDVLFRVCMLVTLFHYG
ncbi:hypothetical protein HanRHA438_Chr12g0573831 [Helianthus annuus]|nr:hypothetical protein HanRHA438_Chr12g0573831 [Helianthus annuus]